MTHLHSCFIKFSDLQEDLAAIQNNPSRSIYCSQRLLCRTLAGNNVYILTVTSPGTTVSSATIVYIPIKFKLKNRNTNQYLLLFRSFRRI